MKLFHYSLFLKVYLFLFFMYTTVLSTSMAEYCCMLGAHKGQKRELDPVTGVTDGYQPSCGF